MNANTKAKDFKEVLNGELEEISHSRDLRQELIDGLPPVSDSQDAYQKAAESELLGLAFSGGGIRSATFNLGILQGLAQFRLLPRIDYLSTVSGGGYIGSWLATLIKRLGLESVADGLGRNTKETREQEPQEIQHLRQFSNYLTPRLGLLNADSLTTAAIYVRNLLLNLTILIAALSALVMLPRILNIVDSAAESLPFLVVIIVFILLASLAVYFIHMNLAKYEEVDKWYLKQGAIQIIIILPVLLAAWSIAVSLHPPVDNWQNWWRWVPWITLGVAGINAGVWIARRTAFKDFWYRLVFVIISVAVGCTLVWRIALPFSSLAPDTRTIIGVPLILGIMFLGGILYIGLMGVGFETRVREWWGRIGAWIMIYGIGYLVVFALSIYGGHWLTWINKNVGAWLNQALASGWILTTIGGLLAGKSAGTGKKDTPLVLKILITITPYLFILGIAILLAFGVESLIPSKELPVQRQLLYLCGLFAALVIAAMLLSWRVNINEFSMHNYYRNRLVRCYIGASDRNRQPNPFTGFDMKQHYVRISDLTTAQPDVNDPRIEKADLKEPYVGPYYLINTTLNLVAGENLAWQQRKASSFIFAPKYSGYEVWAESKQQDHEKLAKNGFRPTGGYEDGLSLGTAMAVSGAAVNPNMGHYSSPPKFIK